MSTVEAIFRVTSIGVAIIGVAVLAWALFSDRSRGRKRCPRCWYDMDHVEAMTCPECGYLARHVGKLHKTRRRKRWAAGAVFILLLAGMIDVTPRVQRDGWWAIVPTPVLRLCLSLFAGDAEKLWDEFADAGAIQGPLSTGSVYITSGNRVIRRGGPRIGAGAGLIPPSPPVPLSLAGPSGAMPTTMWQELLLAYHSTRVLERALDDVWADPMIMGGMPRVQDRLKPYGALHVLSSVSNRARIAVPVLFRMLQSDDPMQREVSGQTLGSLGVAIPSIVDRLVAIAGSGDRVIAGEAMRTLGRIGTSATSAVSVLLRHADASSPPGVRLAAIEALLRIRPAHRDLLGLWQDLMLNAPDEIGAEAVSLYTHWSADIYGPALLDVLKQGAGPRVVDRALRVLPVDAGAPADLEQALHAVFRGGEARSYRAAIATIQRLQPDSTYCVPLLIEVLEDTSDPVRLDAVKALAIYGDEAAPAVTKLVTALHHPTIGPHAARALGAIGPAAFEAIGPLESAAELYSDVRLPAATAMLDIGAPPEVLGRMLRNHPVARDHVSLGLWRLGPEAAVAYADILAALDDPNPVVRVRLVSTVRQIGLPVARSASDELRRLVRTDAHANVRVEAMNAFAQLSEPASLVDVLRVSVREDAEAGVRLHAASTLAAVALATEDESLRAEILSVLRDAERAEEDGNARARLGELVERVSGG